MFHIIKRKLCKFNIFKVPLVNENRQLFLSGTISTYIFLISLMISLIILTSYYSATVRTITKTDEKPDLDTYRHLRKDYSSSLRCPCENVAVKYEKFITINPRFHQYCSSYFVQKSTIDPLVSLDLARRGSTGDRPVSITNIFTILRDFCILAEQTVMDSLNCFYSLSLVSGYVIEQQLFISQAQSFINLFDQTTTNSFNRSLQLLRSFFNGNQVMLGYGSNFYAMNSAISYEQYYSECKLLTCSYLVEIHREPIEVITACLGILGGLRTVLTIVVPLIVNEIVNIIRKCRKKNEEVNENNDNGMKHQNNKLYLTNMNLE